MDEKVFAAREDDDYSDSWDDSTSRSASLELNTKMYEHNPTFQLHMIQKKETKSDRPTIKSNRCQRLSFYRAYTASANKSEILCRHAAQFNRFLWLYTMNLIFKSLPLTFIHIFLAAYTPEEHIFLSKMVPFCFGFKFLLVVASFFEVLTYMDTLLLMFHYFVNGLLFKNPWNRCKNSTYFDVELNETIRCYELENFVKQFVNHTYQFSGNTYKDINGKPFQVAQVEFFRLSIGTNFYIRDLVYFTVLWGAAAYLTYYVSNKFFWKSLNYYHWIVIIIDAIIFLYLFLQPNSQYYMLNEEQDNIPAERREITSKLWIADIDMLAEPTTAPPVIHVLTSRSSQPINPTGDSAAIVLSNAALFMFRGLLTAKITKYCEVLIGVPVHYSESNQHHFFFIFPIFFATLYLGDIYNIVFLGFNFLTELLTVTVAFRCFIDAAIYEWRLLKPWMVITGMFVAAVGMYTYTGYESRLILYIYAKGFATLTEIIFLYILYPIGRFIDDYTFHFGVSLTTLRKLSLQLFPFYYIGKFIIMMDALFDVLANPHSDIKVSHYRWSWCLMLVPILLGMIYIIYKYLIIKKTTWSVIFRPVPLWGPKDFSERQLRKQYDSRLYIRSDVPQVLSRHLISKTESKIYKIDVRYDIYRRSTLPAKEIRFKGETQGKKQM